MKKNSHGGGLRGIILNGNVSPVKQEFMNGKRDYLKFDVQRGVWNPDAPRYRGATIDICKQKIEGMVEFLDEHGIVYEFEPGMKKHFYYEKPNASL